MFDLETLVEGARKFAEIADEIKKINQNLQEINETLKKLSDRILYARGG